VNLIELGNFHNTLYVAKKDNTVGLFSSSIPQNTSVLKKFIGVFLTTRLDKPRKLIKSAKKFKIVTNSHTTKEKIHI
jgi:hypothetical protein